MTLSLPIEETGASSVERAVSRKGRKKIAKTWMEFWKRHPHTAAGERLYAIGDIHGRADLLEQMLQAIWDDMAKTDDGRTARILFLGDLIDRGPDSKTVLSLVLDLTRTQNAICLLGNHEQLLMNALMGQKSALKGWLKLGGWETLKSYSKEERQKKESAADYAMRLAREIPKSHIEFLENLPTSYRSGTYFFAHAGVRPGVKLKKQDPHDLVWIRKPFLETQADLGAIVVHGHSIVDNVTFFNNRIAVDTQAWKSGKLSCVRLAGEGCSVIFAKKKGVKKIPIWSED